MHKPFSTWGLRRLSVNRDCRIRWTCLLHKARSSNVVYVFVMDTSVMLWNSNPEIGHKNAQNDTKRVERQTIRISIFEFWILYLAFSLVRLPVPWPGRRSFARAYRFLADLRINTQEYRMNPMRNILTQFSTKGSRKKRPASKRDSGYSRKRTKQRFRKWWCVWIRSRLWPPFGFFFISEKLSDTWTSV